MHHTQQVGGVSNFKQCRRSHRCSPNMRCTWLCCDGPAASSSCCSAGADAAAVCTSTLVSVLAFLASGIRTVESVIDRKRGCLLCNRQSVRTLRTALRTLGVSLSERKAITPAPCKMPAAVTAPALHVAEDNVCGCSGRAFASEVPPASSATFRLWLESQ